MGLTPAEEHVVPPPDTKGERLPIDPIRSFAAGDFCVLSSANRGRAHAVDSVMLALSFFFLNEVVRLLLGVAFSFEGDAAAGGGGIGGVEEAFSGKEDSKAALHFAQSRSNVP